PAFSGVMADGQTSVTVTMTVKGDTTFEPDDAFNVTLSSATNPQAPVYFDPAASVATATIANDDPQPFRMAFVGFDREDAGNSPPFFVLDDIPAGTQIHLTDNAWNGKGFASTESFWTWTADTDIAAGTVVTMNGLLVSATVAGSFSSNLGELTLDAGTV